MEKIISLGYDKVQIQIYRFKWDDKWSVLLEKDVEGVALKITKSSLSIYDAIADAVAAWEKATGTGIPEFAGPLITFEPSSVEEPF